MESFKNLSIRSKLIIILLVMTFITFSLCSAIFVYNDLNLFRKSMVRHLVMLASTVGANSRASIYFDDPIAASNILSSLKEDPQIRFAILYDAKDKLFVTYKLDETVKIKNPDLTKFKKEGYLFSEDNLEVISPILLNNKTVGKIYLNAHLKEYKETLESYISLVGIILLMTFSVSFVLAFKLQSIISKPILSLANTTKLISQKPDYSIRVWHDGADELGTLFSGFNEMVSQIEKRERDLYETNSQLACEMVERKRSEEALQISEDRLNLALEAITDGVWDWNVSTGEVFFSPRYYTLLGYSPNELEPHIRTFKKLMHPKDLEKAMAAMNSHLNGDTPLYEYETRLLTKSGKWLWTLDRGKVVSRDENGQPLRVIGTDRDISERKRAEEALKKSHEQIRKLYSHAQSMVEEERSRIAREVHDELGQTLTALKFDLLNVEDDLLKSQIPVKKQIRKMVELTDKTIETVQRITTELRPQILDIFGICEAIEWQAKEFQKRTGILCKINITKKQVDLNKDCATTIFRIFQETLTNVARHANADKIQVSLYEETDRLVLVVRDNGKGISEKQISDPKSFGLIGIRERTIQWGGHVEIEGYPKRGTTLSVSIPI